MGFKQTTRDSDRKLQGKNERKIYFTWQLTADPVHRPPTHKSEDQGDTEAQAGKAGISDPGCSGCGPISASSTPLHSHPTFHYLPLGSRLTAWSRQHHYQTEGTCSWRQQKQFGSHVTSDEVAEPQDGVSGETPTLDVGVEGMRATPRSLAPPPH